MCKLIAGSEISRRSLFRRCDSSALTGRVPEGRFAVAEEPEGFTGVLDLAREVGRRKTGPSLVWALVGPGRGGGEREAEGDSDGR